ncbi:MAG: NOL1/NOP2/sun family putative RNA methylase [bacterium]
MNMEKLFVRYQSIIQDYEAFIDFLNKPQRISLRLNTLKSNPEIIVSSLRDFRPSQLKFYKDGYILENGYGIGNHFTHQLGLIYIQEIASMIPAIVLEPKQNEILLDLCASPGSKTTQLAQMMHNTGIIVANEINPRRISRLIHNVKKCGLLNAVIISIPGERIGDMLPNYFDKILLDAPCSAEGTIRKSKKVLYHWGIKNIQKMSYIQKGLIVSAFRALKPGGTMVYSTCTVAPEENEGVIDYFLKKCPEAEILPINISNFKVREGIVKWQNENYNPRVKQCVRILPQDNDTAPFFVAKITKRGIPSVRPGYHGKIEFQNKVIELYCQQFGIQKDGFEDYAVFQKGDTFYIATPEAYAFFEVSSIKKGLEIGRIYSNSLKPDNDFIQIFGREAKKNILGINEWQLKKFLKGESIKKFANGLDEFVIVKFNNLPIGIGHFNKNEIKSSIRPTRRIK